MTVPVQHLFMLAGVLFAIGACGFFLRRNVIIVLMCIELMLNAANLTFLAASRLHETADGPDPTGPVFALFVILVAAVEAAVGLALVIALYRRKQTASLAQVRELRG
ncbi:MAG: NADH-quinone oxidoreductase subunit NuoK [Planctomycetota bacterium]|nr:NADH-quinone oxidoreductase subunit NuoK [Planctomycetota bacterium]MDP6519041.1 NADH-quinone oxidoreductase subunit NuoK [Planctomycetota bacterium]MDP6837985.1 NADH-quinone oxidoreductase subunit NuoK [Planctomycetota bacterium]MDP6956775.1 NADH-quinone oxidoreductase subunit NuoK [Planctomycetota bacterium]